MQLYRSEGIVLQITPFRDYDQIVTLFTLSFGLIKLFFKGKKRLTFLERSLIAPLTTAEFLYVQGKGDLFRFHEASLIHQNLRLRDKLETLEVADKLIRSLLISQWPHKTVPELYHLFRALLEKLPEALFPKTLLCVFLLKLLKHEGLLQMELACSTCQTTPTYRAGGERFCEAHKMSEAIFFCPQEEIILSFLVQTRSFRALSTTPLPLELEKKIEQLFSSEFGQNRNPNSKMPF